MLWKILDTKLEPYRTGYPVLPGTAIAMAAVDDYRPALIGVEGSELAQMAETRQLGFSSGRHCAHKVLELLGLGATAIGRRGRLPVWPEHAAGSITHSRKIAAAVASTHFNSVGVDVEETTPVERKLYPRLFTGAEQQLLANCGFDAAALLFSAKEAGYKAIYPLNRRFISFTEAEVQLDTRAGTFRINYMGEYAPNKLLNKGRGYWYRHNGHVMTVFTI